METMLKTLLELGTEELRSFQWHLRQRDNLEGLQPIPKSLMENASRTDTVDLMIQNYPSDATRIMFNVLKKIVRNDLLILLEAFPNPNPHKAPVQEPDGSAVIGPGQQAGVPSVIPPVTMDTASGDSAPPPAKKTAKSPAVGPMEEIRQFLPLVSVKPRTVVCESVNFEKKWEWRVSVSLECFTFQDHRPFTSKKDASHNAYLTLGCAGQICQPDESKVKEKVNQHFSQRSFPLPKDVYKQPEPLKFCCSLTNITCVFIYTGTDTSEASARQAAFQTALSCLSPLMRCATALPTRAEEKLKTLLATAAGLKIKGSVLKSVWYRGSAKLKFTGFCVEAKGERGERTIQRSKKETQARLSQHLLRLLQGPETPDTASTSKDQLSMRNALQEWFQQRGLVMPVFEDADGKFGTRITFSAPLCLYSDCQDSQEKAGKKLVEEIKRRFAFIFEQ